MQFPSQETRGPGRSDVTGFASVFVQTKDALFTILHDLRPQDHFNIIGFSNRIKVWKDHLVSVTPDNVRDGKVYIHHMSPSGGKCESLFPRWPRRDNK